jgi:hypothetical protein
MGKAMQKAVTAKEVLERIKDRFPMPSTHGTAWSQLKDEPEFFDAVIEAIAGGMSIQYFAQAIGLSPGKVSMWLNRQEGERQKRYDEARKARAAGFADRILRILDEVEAGTLTPPAARVMADNMRWMAERYDPDLWGNKIQARLEVVTTVEMHLAAVEELARRIKRGDERPVIEGEVLPTYVPKKDLGPDPVEAEEVRAEPRRKAPSYRELVDDLLG